MNPIRTVGQVGSAAITGALIGAAGGAAMSSAMDLGWLPGAVIGAVILGGWSGWADARRVPGRPQPISGRIVASTFFAAIVGWGLDLMLPQWPVTIPTVIVGAVAGAIGFRLVKIALGVVTGLLVGLGFDLWAPDIGWAVPVALTVLLYRTLAGWWWRGRDQVRIMGESMVQADALYVVPFAELTGHVGADYLERYARNVGARFDRSPADIGILERLDLLTGPSFDPDVVHSMVREFYEHTSRFKLSIVPEWRRWMRLPYRVYRQTVAKPLGQANAPFEIEEVQQGVNSWIDTIDVDDDGVADVRAWIRAYEDGEPLYVGIYTVKTIEDVAYVAVGFPLPSSNFTATLLPSNHRGDGLLLRSHADAPYAGHYLSFIADTGELTTLQMRAFGEEIDVFVDEGELGTEHRFTLGGVLFLTLHYEMKRA
ncbi:MAG: hypothetical protein M3N43_13675 [Actinomycetota bacterium]|nr:hypothetical protein [Actinomycetota bacterium]